MTQQYWHPHKEIDSRRILVFIVTIAIWKDTRGRIAINWSDIHKMPSSIEGSPLTKCRITSLINLLGTTLGLPGVLWQTMPIWQRVQHLPCLCHALLELFQQLLSRSSLLNNTSRSWTWSLRNHLLKKLQPTWQVYLVVSLIFFLLVQLPLIHGWLTLEPRITWSQACIIYLTHHSWLPTLVESIYLMVIPPQSLTLELFHCLIISYTMCFMFLISNTIFYPFPSNKRIAVLCSFLSWLLCISGPLQWQDEEDW